MFDRILRRMQEMVRERQYVITLHAEEEMEADGLTIGDIEDAILTGEIVRRERDRVTAEPKYLLKGPCSIGSDLIVVAKLSITGKMVLITVYLENERL